MKPFISSTIAAFALAGAAQAQPVNENPPTRTIICLDVGGQTLPTVCKVPPSRLDPREDICTCPQGVRVEAPVCGPGQRPPAQTRAFDRARKQASRDGSLIGDLYKGQPMCVRPRNAVTNP